MVSYWCGVVDSRQLHLCSTIVLVCMSGECVLVMTACLYQAEALQLRKAVKPQGSHLLFFHMSCHTSIARHFVQMLMVFEVTYRTILVGIRMPLLTFTRISRILEVRIVKCTFSSQKHCQSCGWNYFTI